MQEKTGSASNSYSMGYSFVGIQLFVLFTRARSELFRATIEPDNFSFGMHELDPVINDWKADRIVNCYSYSLIGTMGLKIQTQTHQSLEMHSIILICDDTE